MELLAFFSSRRLALLLGSTAAALTLGCGSGPGLGDTGALASNGACDAKSAPYAGSLCGPAGACAVVTDEVVTHSTSTLSNGMFVDFGPGQAPTVALDATCAPHVLTALAWSPTTYSSRDAAAGWSDESTSLPSYSGALAFGADGQPRAAVSDGNFNTSVWARNGGWNEVGPIPGQVGIYGQGLAVDGTGALHAALWGEHGDSAAVYAGSWTSQDGPAAFDAFPPVIAVSKAAAAAHVAYWARSSSNPPEGLELLWWTSPLAPEVVATGGSTELPLIVGIATSAPDAQNPGGKPHVVYEVALAGGGSEVVYATRTGPSQWTAVSIAQDSPATSQNPCQGKPPTAAGQTCPFDYGTRQPVGIAASQSGDARVFFAVRHFFGTLAAQCVGGSGTPVCGWSSPEAGSETDTLMVAWISGGSAQTAPLVPTRQPSAGTVAVDAAGTMHLALYDAETTGHTTVFSTRYLQIGPAGQ